MAGTLIRRKPRSGDMASIVSNMSDDADYEYRKRVIMGIAKYFDVSPVQTNEEIVERINGYIRDCCEEGLIPTIEGLCCALGINTNTFRDWESYNAKLNPERSVILQKAKSLIQSFDAELAMQGKIPQVIYIFRSKNYYGMKDQVDHLITPNLQKTTGNATEMRQKYLESAGQKALPEKGQPVSVIDADTLDPVSLENTGNS